MANQTHSMVKLKRVIDEVVGRGGKVIDTRTRVGKAIAAWRAQVADDLGGPEGLSVQQQTIIDVAMRTKLLLDSVDAWLVRQPRIIDGRRRSLFPVVQQRTALADSLVRQLTALGLGRVAKQVPSLRDYLEGKAPLGRWQFT